MLGTRARFLPSYLFSNLHVTPLSLLGKRATVANVADRSKGSRDQFSPFNSSSLNSFRGSSPLTIMRFALPLLSLAALLVPVQSLYFYIDGTTPKCFFEELPKDTLVVGHYTAEEYDEQRKVWSKHDGLNIFISVDVRLLSPTLLSPEFRIQIPDRLIPTPLFTHTQHDRLLTDRSIGGLR